MLNKKHMILLKNDKFLKKCDFIRIINLLSKTCDFIKNYKFVNKTWKDVIPEKIKVFPLVCSKYLSSWTGLGMSGHVRFPNFSGIF